MKDSTASITSSLIEMPQLESSTNIVCSDSSTKSKPYRKGVVAIFLKGSKVLVGERINGPGVWQFPQGGFDPDDLTPEDTLKRELNEEFGLLEGEFYILTKLDHTLKYEFYPTQWLKPQHAEMYAGQELYWFLCKLTDENYTPDLSKATDQEFSQLKWVTPLQAYEGIADYKKKVYYEALTTFNLLK